MKKLRLVFITVVLCILVSCSCVFAEEYKIDGEESNSFVEIKSESVDGNLKFTITNNSNDVLHNVHFISDKSNKYVSNSEIVKLPDIKVGKKETVTLSMYKLGNGFFKDVALYFGGVSNLIIISIVMIICIALIVLIWLRKGGNSSKLSAVFSFLICIICVLSVVGVHSSIVKYSPLKIGNNYSNTIEVTDKGNVSSKFTLKYNKDEVKFNTKESEEDVDFNIKYEYDDSIPCVDEPIVKTKGEVGKKKVITVTEYRNGEQVNVEKTEQILVEPKEQVEVQGTKTTVEIENIEAKKTYVSDKTMRVGDYKLETDLEKSKENMGKKEVTYKWDNNSKKVISSDKVIKKPGTNTWKAGSLVIEEELVKADTKYISVKDKPVGWENTISESVDGNKTTVYTVKIDKKTGKPIENSELKYLKSFEKKPVNGEKEVGVLKTEEVVTSRKLEYKEDNTKWDNEEVVESEGQDKIEKVVNIMKLNVKNGSISDSVEEEVSREVVQKDITKVIVKGNKKPIWVEEKKATDQVKYNTVYIPDDSLSGDEQVVVTKGQMGRLVTTQLVAVDENGNKISSYKPKVIERDSLQKPVDEVIKVATDSKLLKK